MTLQQMNEVEPMSRTRPRRIAAVFLLMAVLLLSREEPLSAYFDPGAGSMFLQTIIAGSLAVIYTIKLFWREIKARAQDLHRRLRQRRG